MSKRTCSIQGCESQAHARTWCKNHYRRWQRHGDPTGEHRPQTRCGVDGCENAHDARGFCSNHLKHWRKYGDPLGSPVRQYGNPLEALAARTRRTDSCWIWTGAVDERGYGSIRTEGRTRRVHRFAWEQVHGPIPPGMEVDHTCWNPSCVRVDHLRLASREENNRNRNGARRDNNSTGVRNVYPNGRGFAVQVRMGGVSHYGGTFPTITEADRAAETMRASLFGDYAGAPHPLAEVGLTEKNGDPR